MRVRVSIPVLSGRGRDDLDYEMFAVRSIAYAAVAWLHELERGHGREERVRGGPTRGLTPSASNVGFVNRRNATKRDAKRRQRVSGGATRAYVVA